MANAAADQPMKATLETPLVVRMYSTTVLSSSWSLWELVST
jgi:hypothetical protein